MPMEIWLNIFSHFDYFTLKKCTMINRDFKAISDHMSLDKISFRGPAPLSMGTKIIAKEVEVHPVLQTMSYECSEDINDAYLFGPDYGPHESPYSDQGTYKVVKSSAIDEFATSPALQHIKIKIKSGKYTELKNDDGVTVRDVLNGLASYFGRPMNNQSATLFDIAPWLADKKQYPNVENRRANYRELYMGDHTGWTGFDRQSLDKEGNLILVAEWFDS